MKEHSFVVSGLLHNFVGRGFGFVDEIWVEDIKFISLDHFRWRIINAADNINANCAEEEFIHILIVSLVVLIPFVPGMNTVKVTGFSRSILVFPIVTSCASDILFKIEKFLFLIQFFLSFRTVQSF